MCDSFKTIVKEESYGIVLWSVDTTDWRRPPVSTIVNNVLKNVRGGDIILMHDFVSGRSNTPDALEIIIPALLERSYRFVTVSELVSFIPGEE